MVAKKINILVIVGPTASGKTQLALSVAKKYNGEIITADSRTVYKDLDIGTAKPSGSDQKQVKHWGLDIVEPGQEYTVADFKKYAQSAIDDIHSRNKLPIITGGSGLYIDALLYDFSLAPPNKDRSPGLEKLSIEELRRIIIKNNYEMPQNDKNKRYLIRSIEKAGVRTVKSKLKTGAIIIGLKPEKEVLRKRIQERLRAMLKQGVSEEYKKALKKYGKNKATESGIYKIISEFEDSEEIIEKAILSDWHLAKRQMTWFKRNKDIIWFRSPAEARVWIDKLFGGKLN
jgi:tRNA dimethylallyltransferase